MATIKKFEDLLVWQKAREICVEVFKLTRKSSFAKDYALKNQILDSSGSAMDNIAEGFERGGNKEFIQFLAISKGSTGETRSQIYRAFDFGYVSKNELTDICIKTNDLGRMIWQLINYLQQSGIKGVKYRNRILE